MTDQLTLDYTPRARRADPLSSHAAADRLERSGRAAAQCLAVLRAVREWPGRTSRELAEVAGLDRYLVARRASELHKAGKVRRTLEYHGAELRLWPA